MYISSGKKKLENPYSRIRHLPQIKDTIEYVVKDTVSNHKMSICRTPTYTEITKLLNNLMFPRSVYSRIIMVTLERDTLPT